MSAAPIDRHEPATEPVKAGVGLPEKIAELLGVPVEQLRPLPRVA